MKLIYLILICLCALVSSNPAYSRIPVWVYPQNGYPPNQNLDQTKGTEIIKSGIAQEVVGKILENPVISAIVSPSSIDSKKADTSVINNYIIVPSDFLKLNESINDFVAQDNAYKIIKAKTKDLVQTKTAPRRKQNLVRYKNNNDGRDSQKMQQYDKVLDNRRCCQERNCCYPKNFQRCGCPNCNMQYRSCYNGQTPGPNQQESRKMPNSSKNKALAKNVSQRRSNRKRAQQKNNGVTDLDVELFEDLGNIYDPKPKQRHCESVDDINCIPVEDTHEELRDKTVKDAHQNRHNTNTRSQNQPNTNNNRRKNKQRTKRKEEAIIRDFVKQFPNIPEKVIRKVVHNVKKQLYETLPRGHNQPKDHQSKKHKENHHHQHSNISHNNQNHINNKHQGSNNEIWHPPYYSTRPYESKIPEPNLSKEHHSVTSNEANNSKKPNKGTIKGNRRVLQQNKSIERSMKNENIASLPTTTNIAPVSIETTTELPAIFETTKSIELTTEMAPTSIEANKYTTEKVASYENGMKFPELGAEDVVLQVPNMIELIDDYFPDFRNDNKAHSLKDEDIYESDYYNGLYKEKDTNFEKYNAMTTKSQDVTTPRTTTTPKHIAVTERSDKTFESCSDEYPIESAEIKYQTPPSFHPNFLTKKINPKILLNSGEINIYTEDYHFKSLNEAVADELSKYSATDFVTHSKEIEAILNEMEKENSMDNHQNRNVETVYARSKVMNYGKEKHDDHIESIFDETTQATIVLAKSYQEDEYW